MINEITPQGTWEEKTITIEAGSYLWHGGMRALSKIQIEGKETAWQAEVLKELGKLGRAGWVLVDMTMDRSERGVKLIVKRFKPAKNARSLHTQIQSQTTYIIED